MKKAVGVMVCIVAFLCLAPSAGAEKGKAFTVTPFIGGYTFDGAEDLKTNPVYGLRFGYKLTDHWGLEAMVDYVRTENNKTSVKASSYGYRLEALYNFMPEKRLVPFIAAGVGGRSIRFDNTNDGDRNQFLADYGAGLKYFLTDSMALRADVRQLILTNGTLSNLEYTLGFSFLFGGKATAPTARAEAVVLDADRDGVPDSADECPRTPSGVKVDINGCPLDADKDGVADYLDKCPGTPSGVKVDTDGCPLDADQDGVADYLDKCPGTPPEAKVDANGCPLDSDKDGVPDYRDQCLNTLSGVVVDSDGCPFDADKDGVADASDQCPDTPVGVAVDRKGCPLDSDMDGVPDYVDKCPDTAKGMKVDKDGCSPPVIAPALVEQKQEAQAQAAPVVVKQPLPEKVSIALDVEFDTAKAVVKKKYDNEIRKVADFMKEYPWTQAAIHGYTDNVGKEAYNVRLSQARANSIRQYLIDNFGIDASRITAIGYGPSNPIASNATAEGRKQNRRAEAHIETVQK